jgi:isopentenyl-diphosphate Delta-isomerase
MRSIAAALVVLVNENDDQVGTQEKFRAHQDAGQLHRAVSVLVLNSAGQLMLQQRSVGKFHFRGLWSNTCCTHPGPSIGITEAANARLLHEMGFQTELQEVATFVYRATDPATALVEHEFDHLFVGVHDSDPDPSRAEVEAWTWADQGRLRDDLERSAGAYTPWLKLALERVAGVVALRAGGDWAAFSCLLASKGATTE